MNTPIISMSTMNMIMAGVRAATGSDHWMPPPRQPIWHRHHHSSVSAMKRLPVHHHQSVSIRTAIPTSTQTSTIVRTMSIWMYSMAVAAVAVAAASAAVEFHSHNIQRSPMHKALSTANKCQRQHIVSTRMLHTHDEIIFYSFQERKTFPCPK